MADIGIIKFQLAGMHFGIFADRILEIVRFAGVRKIPSPLPYVVGLSEIRHYLVVVLDFRKRLGLSPLSLKKEPTMIATKISSGMIGLLVESISHFKRIPEEKILPPIAIAGFPEHLISGVLAEDEDIMIIPNLDKIFSSYTHVQLLPITPSEKIAFQYRFTPGSLTRTLENTLNSQQYLDHHIVRQLPRSMNLPSVHVHKMTSYYADFCPTKYAPLKTPEQHPMNFQQTRPGDATYLSLPEQLPSRRHQPGYEGNSEKSKALQHFEGPVISGSYRPVPDVLEDILHIRETGVIGKLPGGTMSPETLIARPELARGVAQSLHLSPVHLTKYFTYYKHPGAKQNVEQRETSLPFHQGVMPISLSLDEKLEELCQADLRIEALLQTLNDEQSVLTRRHLHRIGRRYRVALVKIAKLAVNFPEISFDLKVESDEKHEQSGNEFKRNDQQRQETDYSFLDPQIFRTGFSTTSVSQYIQHLVDEQILSEDHALRYVAAQLRIPTCRLSKLRNYYRFKDA